LVNLPRANLPNHFECEYANLSANGLSLAETAESVVLALDRDQSIISKAKANDGSSSTVPTIE